MASTSGILAIRVEHPQLARTLHEAVLPGDRVRDLLRRLLTRMEQGERMKEWELCDDEGEPLALDLVIADWLSGRAEPPTLVLRPTWQTIAEMDVSVEQAKKESETEETIRIAEPSAGTVKHTPAPGDDDVAPKEGSGSRRSEVAPTTSPAPAKARPPAASPPPAAVPLPPAPAPKAAPFDVPPVRSRQVPGSWGVPSTQAIPVEKLREAAERGGPRRSATEAGGGPGYRSFVERVATVRYYSRMNPHRVFPLLVTLTKESVQQIVQKHVAQRASGPFAVEEGELLDIEPVIPGCQCYPPRLQVRLAGAQELVARFHVVPLVLGRVQGAVVYVRQRSQSIAEVALDVKIVQRTWVLVSGMAAFFVPFFSAILKHFRLDFESQRQEGFNFYLSVARLLFDVLSPLGLTLALVFVTSMAYLAEPRARDQFWEFKPLPPESTTAESTPSGAGR